MRYLKLAFVTTAALALTGCLQSLTLITVRADGSGTIEQTTTMTAQAAAQFTAMAGAFGGKDDKGQAKAPELFTEEEARAQAAKLGPGVRYVSSTPIKTAEAQGLKSLYAFDDITKVTIDEKPGAASGLGGGMTMRETKKENVLFRFAREAGTSLVTVEFPEFEFDKNKKAEDEDKDKAMEGAGLEMAKQMFKGMRITIALKVDGRIVKTNSAYVDGSTVTLLDMDMDKLLANPDLLKKIGRPESLEEAKRLLKDVPGFKINPEREVTVRFAGR